MKKMILAVAAASMAVPIPAVAMISSDEPAPQLIFAKADKDKRGYQRGYRDGRRDAQRINRDTRIWRGNDGRYRCKRDDGTTGLLIGGAAGAVIGSEVAGRGDKTLGAILGGLGGAFLGREIDRSDYRCR